ncbi:MAG TPA: ABC transporter ATP-binding protein [Thermoplasmatales archaeon]|nr:ABC transporter ATP-binding protein [Thermoplasmatales archaeon]
MVSQTPIIHLENVSKVYDEYGITVKALDKISLKIHHGEFVSIIGTSGSGKSTLLHCMGLLDRPTFGKVYIDNKDTSKISGKEIAQFRGEKLGFVFQNYNLIPRLTVLENVILPGRIMQKNINDLEEKAKQLLKEVGILHRADHKGVHLSGGEQQRVAIARALINDPVLVLADEPTGALDTESSMEVMELLEEMNEKKGVTIVFVSHDFDIARYGRRTLALKDGEKIGDTLDKKTDFETLIKKLSNNGGKQSER